MGSYDAERRTLQDEVWDTLGGWMVDAVRVRGGTAYLRLLKPGEPEPRYVGVDAASVSDVAEVWHALT